MGRKKRRGFPSDKARKAFFASKGSTSRSGLLTHDFEPDEEPRYVIKPRSEFFHKTMNTEKKPVDSSNNKKTSEQKPYDANSDIESLKRMKNLLKNENLVGIGEKIKKLNPERIAGAVALSTSIITGNPLPSMLYQGYKAYKYYDKLNAKFSEAGLRDELLNITKKNANSFTQKLSEDEIEKFSNRATKYSQDMGYFHILSENSAYSESGIQTLFKSTLDNGLKDGIEKATSFAVEAVF